MQYTIVVCGRYAHIIFAADSTEDAIHFAETHPETQNREWVLVESGGLIRVSDL